MAETLPPARVVGRPTWLHWLVAAIILVIAIGVPILFRVLAPAKTAWIRWAFHVVPVVALGVAAWLAVRAGRSPWVVVLDPARRPDARRWIYVFFDVVFATGYLIAFKYFIPNRHDWAMTLLELLPLAAWLMAIGTLVARPWSWWVVVAGAATMLIWMIGSMFVLGFTASYLAGVYGAFGQGASAGIVGIMLVLVQFVALLPAFQLKWILTRSGRRGFALRPLWPAPPRREVAPALGTAA